MRGAPELTTLSELTPPTPAQHLHNVNYVKLFIGFCHEHSLEFSVGFNAGSSHAMDKANPDVDNIGVQDL